MSGDEPNRVRRPGGPVEDPAFGGELARLTAGRDRLQGLLDSVIAVGSGLDLASTLQRIVEAAAALVDAEHGALSLMGRDRVVIEFHTAGLEPLMPASPLPAGHGILGLLVTDGPIRLADLSEHPAANDLPPGHPPTRTFLGVPLRAGDEVFGNLYLTEKRGGVFTEDDESLLEALGAAAGVAIKNARLYEESRRRERWLDAAGEITRALLAGDPPESVLSMVASRARELSGGDCAMVLVPRMAKAEAEALRVAAVDGPEADVLGKAVFPITGSLTGQVFRTGSGLRVEDLSSMSPADPNLRLATLYGPALFMPLASRGATVGTLIVMKVHGAPPFSADAGTVTESFARQAALALQLAETQRASDRLARFEERERVAVDLQDNVIQRVFASGLLLESVARRTESAELRSRLERAADGLDQTIRDTRRTIHSLQAEADPDHPKLRQRLVAAAADAAADAGLQPTVQLDGPLDGLVPDPLADHAVLVVREGVADMIRRGVTAISVTVSASDTLTVTVTGEGARPTVWQVPL